MDRMRAQMRGDRPRRPEGVRFDPARPAAHGDAPSPPRFPHISSGHPDETDADAAAAAAAAASAAAASDAASDADANAFAASTDADAHRAALAALESDRATLRDEILRVARVDAERAAELDAERARRADLEDELEELRAFVRAGGGRVPARAADASRPSSASASAGDEELARLRDQLRESLDARSEDARAAAAAAARAAALIDDLEALNVRFAEDAIAADEVETRARDEIRSARDAVSAAESRADAAESRADAAETRLDAALEAAKATATIRIPTGPSRVVSSSSSDEAAAAAERAARAWREDVRRETALARSALADMDAMDRAFRDARERSEATAREHAAAIDDASRRAAEATEDARREFRRLAREATNVVVAAAKSRRENAATAKAAKAKAEAERAAAAAAAAVEESTARRRAAEASAASALAEASSAAEARSEAERVAAAAERRLAEERADAESRRRRHEDERVALERRAAALARERDEAEARHREERRAWSEETRKLRAAVLAGGYGDGGDAAGTVPTVSTVPTAVFAGTGTRSRASSPVGPGVVLGADASASRLAPSSPERVPGNAARVRPIPPAGYDGYIGSLPPSPAPPPPPPAPPPPGADSRPGSRGDTHPGEGESRCEHRLGGREATAPGFEIGRASVANRAPGTNRSAPGEPPPTGAGVARASGMHADGARVPTVRVPTRGATWRAPPDPPPRRPSEGDRDVRPNANARVAAGTEMESTTGAGYSQARAPPHLAPGFGVPPLSIPPREGT